MLGTTDKHTVYEAELTGIILALDIAEGIKHTNEVIICTDNQAAIRATTQQRAVPGQQLVEQIQIHKAIRLIRRKRGIKIKIIWTPGHEGVEGNEEADRQAGKAIIEGDINTEHLEKLSDLPISQSAVRQRFEQELKIKERQWWTKSPRYEKMKRVDESMLSANFTRIIDKLPRANGALLMQLRIGHIPLNGYLHTIRKIKDPMCQACTLEKETVKHFLVDCPRYDGLQLKIQQEQRCRDVSIKTLLSNPKIMKMLFEYINATRRFENTYGTMMVPKEQKMKLKARN